MDIFVNTDLHQNNSEIILSSSSYYKYQRIYITGGNATFFCLSICVSHSLDAFHSISMQTPYEVYILWSGYSSHEGILR